jgi:hypothetical protein
VNIGEPKTLAHAEMQRRNEAARSALRVGRSVACQLHIASAERLTSKVPLVCSVYYSAVVTLSRTGINPCVPAALAAPNQKNVTDSKSAFRIFSSVESVHPGAENLSAAIPERYATAFLAMTSR